MVRGISMSSLCIFLFRDFAVRFKGETLPCLEPRKARELFSYLLLNQERPHHRQSLMTLLWEDSSEVRAQKYLRQTMWQLQSGLSPYFSDAEQRLLQVDADWVQIDPRADIWCDTVQFQKAFYRSQGTTGDALDATQVHDLQEAVALYQGDLLEAWYQNWCLVEREHLQNMFLMMLEKLMDYCEVHRRYEDGIVYGMRALKQDYARERTYRRLMRLYSHLGDRNGAVHQYEQCVAALRRELNLAPSQRTQRLYELVRRDKLARTPLTWVSGEVAQTPPLTELLDHLTQLHAALGKVQSVVQRDMTAVARFLQPRR